MTADPTKAAAQMTVRFKFSVMPLKMNLLGAVVLQFLFFVREIVDFLSDMIFGYFNDGKSIPLPAIKNPLLFEPGTMLAAKIRKKELKSEELVRAYIDRIKQVNPILNAVVDERFEDAIKEAQAVDQLLASGEKTEKQWEKEKPFLGVPFTVKENFKLKGLRQTVGLVARKKCVSKRDATAVALMRNAGGIPLGVTNLSELCTWWESDNCVYGRTNNPYDTTRIVGGSSGGEGCIVGAAGSVMGIGSDVGGSIRMPAFFNGIFGHKPTMGITSNEGQKPALSEGLQEYLVTGPLCRYACDLIPVYRVLAGPNINKLKLDKPVDLKTLKVYYMEDDGGFPLISRVNPELRKAQRKVIVYLQRAYGIKSEKVHFPTMVRAIEMWAYTLYGLHKYSFCEEMTSRKGEINVYFELIKWIFRCSSHTLPALTVGLLEKLGMGKKKEEMDAISNMCMNLQQDFQELLGDNGIFLYPSHPTTAPYHNQPLVQPINFAYAAIFNIIGLPVTQVPLGLSPQGLPVGLQVVSSMYNDHNSLAVAYDLEKAFGGWVCPSPVG